MLLEKKFVPYYIAIIFVFFISCLNARVYTGVEVFLKYHTQIVKGKRVGLITNPTGVDGRLNSTADLFKRDPRINLVALFAPEHGIRGSVAAGQNFGTLKDPNTGLPVYTLYGGKDHRPTKESLAKVDVLIYNIQDVGSRSYTYIWHLAECMSAAAEAGKKVIVLDVPNPLGAKVIDGPIRETKYKSFIGLYPIPCVYGMTVGELARFLKHEFNINCRLTIVPMMNYRRGMSWSETGLPWVPTSPMVPTPDAACCFAATGLLGELGIVDIGIGYNLPFQTVAAAWINGQHMSRALNALGLPGIVFREIHYRPFSGSHKGSEINGVQLHVTDPAAFKPVTTAVAVLCYLQANYRQFKWIPGKQEKFDKAIGTADVRNMIKSGANYRNVVARWNLQLQQFNQKRLKWLLKEY